MRRWLVALSATAVLADAGCASKEEKREEPDPPAWLAFRISGELEPATRGIRLAPVMKKIDETLAPGSARIAPDGSSLVVRSSASRANSDGQAIQAAFREAGLAASLLDGDEHSKAMQDLLAGEWLSATEVYEAALKEVRAKAARWALRGAGALGLSDQERMNLRDALAAEAVAALVGRADVMEALRAGWAGIVERGVDKACGAMSARAQDTIRRAVLAGGP